MSLDGVISIHGPGDIVNVEPEVRQLQESTGAVIEEISSTHYQDDSYYTDDLINKIAPQNAADILDGLALLKRHARESGGLIVDRLSKIGVKHIFLLPGGGAMYLNDAVAKHPEFEGIARHHEQACGIAAEAYGRTGAPTPGWRCHGYYWARLDKYNHPGCRRVDRFSPDADFIRAS